MSYPYISGGISSSGDFVRSDYFSRLEKLGDFKVATDRLGGYHYPYLDFGITEIYQKFYFVIGMIFYLTKTKNYLTPTLAGSDIVYAGGMAVP